MADFYKILKADPLGDPWTPNKPGAKPIQNWWCQVEGQDWAVSIGKQVGNNLRPGQHVYGDLKYTKGQKGTEYWKFESQKVPDDVQRPTDDPATPAQATAQQATGGGRDMSAEMPAWFTPVYNMLKEMHKVVTGQDFETEPAAAPTPTPTPAAKPEPQKPEQIAGEPIDKETQETLDNIFTPPETPEDVPDGK